MVEAEKKKSLKFEKGAKEGLNPAEMSALKREPSAGQGEMKEKLPMGEKRKQCDCRDADGGYPHVPNYKTLYENIFGGDRCY